MKILIPLYEIQDYGGITGHIEYLIRGLQYHGHSCELVILRNNDQPTYFKKPKGPRGSYPSATGGEVHLLSGWYGVRVHSYGTEARAKAFRDYSRLFDQVIWALPCPYNDQGPWRELYTHHVPQVACIHDAHYERAYKHLDDVAPYLDFIAPVNESALGAVQSFPGAKVLINNGHEIMPWYEQTLWDDRKKQAVCAHVWKAWKNMDRAVRASLYMDNTMIMGGDGIEGRYMRSKDKCKPKYKGLWEAFLARGHEYHGIMTQEQLFRKYQESRVMIDLSWNKRFVSYGCHYNRAIVEGVNNGCVPVVSGEFMAGSEVFPLDSYIPVYQDYTDDHVAYVIDKAINMHEDDAKGMLFDLRQILLEHFNYKQTCLRYIQRPFTI